MRQQSHHDNRHREERGSCRDRDRRKTVTVGGMCKGSGMIHPNMCTMLGFITSDVDISKELLQEALSEDIKDTYNMVSVDGDTSTNDTVLLLDKRSGRQSKDHRENADYRRVQKSAQLCKHNPCQKDCRRRRRRNRTLRGQSYRRSHQAEAVTLSKSVVTSSLTKAAIYGHDANWGRILCAMGYSGVQFDPEKVEGSYSAGMNYPLTKKFLILVLLLISDRL